MAVIAKLNYENGVDEIRGADLEYFSKTVRHFGKKYPNRSCGGPLNDLIGLLVAVERCFAALPMVPPKEKKPRKQTPGGTAK